MPTFAVESFGCRANQAEGAAMTAGLAAAGWQAAERGEADWIVLNSCTVTGEADAELRRAVRRARTRHPGARIAVAGCYAERAPEEVAGLEGVARVLRRGEGLGGATAATATTTATAAGRTRGTIKVQEGCDRRCSYCVVPQVRGESRSLSLGEVLAVVRDAFEAGQQEVVISGINLGQWGRDRDEHLRLEVLVRAILEQTRLARLRLSSVEPVDWTDELTELLTHPRVARHVHLPMQSGSDAVLRRMRRRYRAVDYAARLAQLRRVLPLAGIGTDIIVGFPGETEAEFAETLALVESLPLTYAHIFPFSARPGTEAAEWLAPPAGVVAKRVGALRAVMAGKRAAFLGLLVGERLPAITLRDGSALTDNYCVVQLTEAMAANALVTVEITNADGERLEGTCAA